MGVPVASPVGGQGAVKGAALMWTKEYFFLRLLVCLSSPARLPPPESPLLGPWSPGGSSEHRKHGCGGERLNPFQIHPPGPGSPVALFQPPR